MTRQNSKRDDETKQETDTTKRRNDKMITRNKTKGTTKRSKEVTQQNENTKRRLKHFVQDLTSYILQQHLIFSKTPSVIVTGLNRVIASLN